MKKNQFRGGKIVQNEDTTHKRSPPLSVKTGQTTAPPLMTKTHYSFEEAFRFVKSIFPSFTHENLLNHGFQSDISFFILVPLDVTVYSAIEGEEPIVNRRPLIFLTLSPFDCEDIERNGSIQLSRFLRGYWYDGISTLTEVLPNYIPNNNSESFWLTILNDNVHFVHIAIGNLLVNHSDLVELVQRIKSRLSNNQNQNIHQEIVKEIPVDHSPKEFHLLIDRASQQTDCKPVDLLRRAIQRNITLFAHVPNDVTVRSSSQIDYSSGIEYLRRPQFLELKALDCENIYNNESDEISDFSAGYIQEFLGPIKRIIPSNERPCLADENPSWRTYRSNARSGLRLTCDDLYVISADVDEIMYQDEYPNFRIPKNRIRLILNHGFVSLERAVEIAKLKYPKCTMNHLLRLGSSGKIKIVAPIPSSITVNKFKDFKKKKISFDNPSEYPALLNLCIGTCEDIERNGKSESDMFDSSYWILQNQLPYKLTTESNILGLATYFENKPYEIKLKSDNLYVEKSNLFKILESESALWSEIHQMLLQEGEERKREQEALELNNNHTSATDETNSELLIVDSGVHSGNQQEREESAGKLPGAPSENIKFLSEIEVLECLRIGKSTRNNRTNPKSKYYDSEFPLPTGGGSGKKFWVESEVKAYQELLLRRRRPVSGPIG
jgi:predicted DNA-binding transcriptional regulator AlpA